MSSLSLSTALDIYIVSKNSEKSSAYLIFDEREALALRSSTFRVFANFIGTRFKEANSCSDGNGASQLQPQQQQTDESLPLQLTEIEVCNLVEAFPHRINLFESISYDELEWSKQDYDKFVVDLNAYTDEFNERQKEEFRTRRVNELVSMRERILEGKRAKLNKRLSDIEKLKVQEDEEKWNDQRDKVKKDLENLESEFEKELEAAKTALAQQTSTTNVEVFVKTPKFYETLFKVRSVGLDEFTTRTAVVYESCQYNAYKYFWSRGYYLTGGAKFGGDFLVYPGEPSRYHSQFILVCCDNNTALSELTSLRQLITYARMATTVKKTFVLACLFDKRIREEQEKQRMHVVDLNDQFQLGLISINWSHI